LYSFEFKSKLRRLNPRLYVDDTRGARIAGEWNACTIRLRRDERPEVIGRTSEERQVLESDTVLSGVPASWVPEYDLFDASDRETPRLLAKGWRTIVLHLVRARYCTLDRARKVFGASLGESDWDRAKFRDRWIKQLEIKPHELI
jgi:hypothetical protein